MFTINEDKYIYLTRGDAVQMSVRADSNGLPYVFQPDEVVRFRVFEKKGCNCVVLQKDVKVTEAVESVDIVLTKTETKFGEIINKPKDYWYEVELNPHTNPQTIVGYDDDGPKVLRLFPEGADNEPVIANDGYGNASVVYDGISNDGAGNAAMSYLGISDDGNGNVVIGVAADGGAGINELKTITLNGVVYNSFADNTTDASITEGSTNAVQGGAVYTAVANINAKIDNRVTPRLPPIITEEDNGKVLTAVDGEERWENPVEVDSYLDVNSENPVQNKVILQRFQNIERGVSGRLLPTVTEEHNDKVLTVVDGKATWKTSSKGNLDTYEITEYAYAICDEDGNIVLAVDNDGKVVFVSDNADMEAELQKLLKAMGNKLNATETDDYAYAVCDENGNVVFAITHDGEVLPKQESGGTSVATTIDYTKCGLTILYLNGDTTDMTKDVAVTLNAKLVTAKGTAIFNGTCTCKWQGSSSVRNGYPKRNYTIKFDTAFDATTAVSSRNGEELSIEPWGEQKKYCLKANWIDPSNARNVVNAKLWASVVASRENVPAKLAAAPNYGAIDGFPVIIVINGEFTGLYTFNIPKDGWMFGMGDGTAEYVVGGESNSESACGFYKEPSFEDEVDFAIEHIPDDVADGTLIASFKEAVNAVRDAPNSADWETAVAPYFDINSAIDYYIFTCCISGHDNLRKNALYAKYDDSPWFMSAYDLDSTLGSNAYGTGVYPVKTQRTQFYEAANGSTKHRLFELIYKYSKDKLKARYWELRNSVLSNENVWYMFNNFVNAIPRAVYNMDAERWADKRDNYNYPMPATTTANVENYMQYYRMHCAYLDKEMEE